MTLGLASSITVNMTNELKTVYFNASGQAVAVEHPDRYKQFTHPLYDHMLLTEVTMFVPKDGWVLGLTKNEIDAQTMMLRGNQDE